MPGAESSPSTERGLDEPQVQRLAAFTDGRGGGNPAGVVIAPELPSEAHMQDTAAAVGYSETAFLAPLGGREYRVRYFSPEREVPFCGHATIAAAVALAAREGQGRFELHTAGGPVTVDTAVVDGRAQATLTSLPPEVRSAPGDLVTAALEALRWQTGELHATYRPALAFAGAWHLVLVAAEHARLRDLDYRFEDLRAVMLAHELTTLQLVWPETDRRFHVRDPFPVGGIVEDPATGAAAAAFGAYLRACHGVQAPARLELLQGADMGRPSRLEVELVPDDPRVRVTGTATAIAQ